MPQRRTVAADALFVLIGSHPHTEGLGDVIARDQWGFVRTGPDLVGGEDAAWPLDRAPFPLETSLPGVFAAGDVRRASVKRCTSAVGECAVTIPQVHAWLEALTLAQAGRGTDGQPNTATPPSGRSGRAPTQRVMINALSGRGRIGVSRASGDRYVIVEKQNVGRLGARRADMRGTGVDL